MLLISTHSQGDRSSECRTYNIDTAISSNSNDRVERTEVHAHNAHLGGVYCLVDEWGPGFRIEAVVAQ